ncbi:MAG: hypothetical protein RL308_2104 [Bacteroidota bacterium]|jgi:hypothetical protein
MKKIITICLLIAATLSVNAQQKPTKEQTLAYLTKTFKLTEGEIVINKASNKYSIEVNEFSENKIVNKIKLYDWVKDYSYKDAISYSSKTYSDLKWEDVITIELSAYSENWLNDNLMSITIKFSSKYKYKVDDSSQYFFNDFKISVIKSKAESFKKALERLVEIAKEENKNPFEK